MSSSGLVTNNNGTSEIVVATGAVLETAMETEILNLDTMTWRAGPQFPTVDRAYQGSSLPYGNSFLAIGGAVNGHGYRDEIWYFDPDRYEWEVISTLAEERYLFVAIALPENVCVGN